ncbi:cytochrome P450 [Micromonospora sp. CPCC 205371]|nr:cytochrome P450 [Micromonospora sp. CPCC 205371]
MTVTTDPGTLVTLPPEARRTALFDYFAGRRAVEAAGPSAQPGVWEVFDYDTSAYVLRDFEAFSNDFSALIPADQLQLRLVARGNMVGLDPPRHNRLRGLVNEAFTPRVISALAPRAAEITDRLLDAALERGAGGGEVTVDLVRDVASPLSATVIAELFGVPEADHEMFWQWSDRLLGARADGDLRAPDEAAFAKRAALVKDAAAYLGAHIRHKRAHPGDDLTSALTAAEVDGERLTDDEIVATIGMFLIAGHLPTAVLVGNTVLCLDEHPDAAAALRDDPGGLPDAIEEVLRWMPPLIRDQRLTKGEVELAGHTLPAGTMVVVWVGSANRDARHFPDPDRFDIRRRPNRHLTFGRGIHYCIGAPLARMEAATAVRAVLRRFPDLAVDRHGVAFHRSVGMLGPVRLQVRATLG